MKKIIFLIIIIAVVLVVGLAILRGDEDTWICEQGQWIKHGNPYAAMPAADKCLPNN